MISETINARIFGGDRRGEAWLPESALARSAFAVCIAGAALAVPVLINGMRHIVFEAPGLVIPMLLVVATTSSAFFWVRYPSVAPYLRITLAGCALLLGANVLWLGFDFPVVDEATHKAVAPLFPIAPIAAFAFGFLAVFRPAFAVVPATIFVVQKTLVTAMAGGLAGFSHYLVIVDTAAFVAVAIVAFRAAQVIAARFFEKTRVESAFSERSADLYYLIIMCIAIGVHFGNYFLSGVGKALLDGGLVSWLLENKTQYLMLGGYNLGSAPLSISSTLFGRAFAALDQTYILVNLAVLIAQAFCFLAFLRKRIMLGWVLFFDVMHVTIFILTGALFIHWILLNSLLLVSVSKMPEILAPRVALVAGIVSTIFGHLLFNTIMLAWYDNRQVRDAGFVAVYADGSEARVPPSFFRESAYAFYGRWFRLAPETGGWVEAPTSVTVGARKQSQSYAWGQVQKVDAMRRGEDCLAPAETPENGESGIAQIDFDLPAAEAFVRARQTWVADRLKRGAPVRYHLFPHDHFSMPWRFREFEEADLEAIVGYYYRVETVCLGWRDGVFQREVMARSASPIFSVANAAAPDDAPGAAK
ncbi:MAG: hypothetical protein AAGC56_08720 [Pseudomonadota bacterium]